MLSPNRGGTFNRPRDWQAFERLTRDLYARLLADHDVDLHGRSGQPQSAVDVYGRDRLTGESVGIQCKGRGDAQFARHAGLTEAELLAEVALAVTFHPPLHRYVVLTTGPNDVDLHRVARDLSEQHARDGLFRIEVHGWDWIEGKLGDHLDLAVSYGLIAVCHDGASLPASSGVARQIGARLLQAIELMNERRHDEDRFTLQSLSDHLGLPDWRRLEQISIGAADADHAELTWVANGLGLSAVWLIEGKGAPFALDPDGHHVEVEQRCQEILALNPRRIVFVRQREGGHGWHDAFVVVERDDVRWYTFTGVYPACDKVGGTGARQLFDFCRLMRRLGRELESYRCYGRHLDNPEYERLLEGEIYPGLLRHGRNDPWWMDFAALRADLVKGDKEDEVALREAMSIVRHVVEEHRDRGRKHKHFHDTLTWGGFKVEKPADGDEDPDSGFPPFQELDGGDGDARPQ